jgi:5-methylcytosine-specific restriction endonuclease McrA
MNDLKVYNSIKNCKCGCGNKIIIQKHHKYYGVPDYISGHNGSRKRPFNKETDKAIICTRCKQEKDLKEFCRDERAVNGRASECRDCHTVAAKKSKILHIENTRIDRRVQCAKRRALKKASAVCAIADMKLLKFIYQYCPNGYEVDHIIPLSKGGSHHPTNLQYLPSVINRQKKNNTDFDCSQFVIQWQSLLEGEIHYGGVVVNE